MNEEIVIPLKNIVDLTGMPVLVFDNSLRVQNFNGPAKRIFSDLIENLSAEVLIKEKN